jgi:pyroglutamyl-peptidase
MHALATQRGLKKARGGFVHVPFLPEQGTPNLSLEVLINALRLAVLAALTTSVDVAAVAGAIS